VDQTCAYPVVDRKRRPASRDYVASLENRVAWLESIIVKLKLAPSQEREAILNSLSFPDNRLCPDNEEHSGFEPASTRPNHRPEVDLQFLPDGRFIYHGPTSIYHAQVELGYNVSAGARNKTHETDETLLDSPIQVNYNSDRRFDFVAHHFGIDLQDDLINSALLHFFKWQYPHFMFIYREAFLREHFGNRQGPKTWSLPLLLVICALGTLMSPSPLDREMSSKFFGAAESIMIVAGLSQPSITAIQTLLCLAFYEIGRGNLSKGWGFSGKPIYIA
jgi:hypothetical protein